MRRLSLIALLYKSYHLKIIFLFFLLLSTGVDGQVKVLFNINQQRREHLYDPVFITGNFADWRPADSDYVAIQNTSGRIIELNLKPGNYEYKFTRGGWDKGEVTSTGGQVPNRQLHLLRDTTVNIIIAAWADDFKHEAIQRKSTASVNVKVQDTPFDVPQLARKKGIWIYLPPGYEKKHERYPVIYMHDAQNLFDERTAGFGEEWGVDEAMDSMIAAGAKPAIIVGINNDPQHRLTEYNPYDNDKYGKAEGEQYLKFIVETLKPYIDENFRTAKGTGKTFIAGSSMGGLISLYAVLKYPKVFGGAGIFSPSFWISGKGIYQDAEKYASGVKGKIYFYAGGKEGESMLNDMEAVEKILRLKSKAKTIEDVDAEAKHNEKAWRESFPRFYQWLIK